MSLVAGLIHQQLSYVYSVTKNRYDDATLTTLYQNIPCRFTSKVQVVKDKNGTDVQTKAEIWLLPEYDDVQEDYQVVYDSTTYIVQAIEKRYNLAGALDHIKLYVV